MIKEHPLVRGVSMSRKSQKGLTLTEIIVTTAIFGIISVTIGTFLSTMMKSSTQANIKIKTYENITMAMSKLERDILQINETLVTSTTELMYISDLSTWPQYNGSADFDGDGKQNISDPDIDSDATLFAPPSARWKIGYNLKDDDDDNDGNIDMRWRLYLTDGKIMKDYSYNEENWGNHTETILSDVSITDIFGYTGSKDELLSIGGASIDSNNDGIVTVDEMDAAGNNNGNPDIKSERDYIVNIKVNLAVDVNHDEKIDAEMNTEIMPPLLYIKRRP
jgi:prepilin-type N-terminal cleavage/methylation domain-containing protein